MQPKSNTPKFFGMTLFQVIVLVGLGLMLCIIIGVSVLVLFSNRNRPSAVLSIPTVQPTYTPYPTYTPLPLPTSTSIASNSLEPSPIPATVAPSNAVKPVGTGVIKVNSWSLEILEVHSDFGIDNSRQIVVLLGNLTNEGTGTDTFTAMFNIVLKDSQGRLYEQDISSSYAIQSKYQTDYAASMSPGATVYLSIPYDVPASEKSFSLVAGSLVSSWSGDVSFTLP